MQRNLIHVYINASGLCVDMLIYIDASMLSLVLCQELWRYGIYLVSISKEQI